MLQAELMTKEDQALTSYVPKYFRGICSACRNNVGCTFPRDPERPVLQCEEFSPHSSNTNTKVRSMNVRDTLPSVYVQNPGVGGLCKSCINFPSCTYPKSVSGSLFCDEYSR